MQFNPRNRHARRREDRTIRFGLGAMLILAILAVWVGSNIGASLDAQNSPNVAVREASSVGEKIAVLEERIKNEKEARETALALKAQEYKEHFDRLNGEQTRIAEILKQSVPREVFENYKTENTAWREKTDRALILIEGRTGGASGFRDAARTNTLAAASMIGAAIAVAGFIVMLVTRRRSQQGAAK